MPAPNAVKAEKAVPTTEAKDVLSIENASPKEMENVPREDASANRQLTK